MKILLVEDDEKISKFIKKGLEEESFTVDNTYDGKEGLYLALIYKYDLIILDLMLPSLDGFSICQKIREKNPNVPILMLSAKSQLEDKLKGFDCGTDDYLEKPFFFDELIVRIKALLRRKHFDNENLITIDNLKIDLVSREVKRENKIIDLSKKEYELLILLVKNKNKVVTSTVIAEKIWNLQESTSSNVINVFIYHLRNKIDFKNQKKLIKTIRGSGYKLEEI